MSVTRPKEKKCKVVLVTVTKSIWFIERRLHYDGLFGQRGRTCSGALRPCLKKAKWISMYITYWSIFAFFRQGRSAPEQVRPLAMPPCARLVRSLRSSKTAARFIQTSATNWVSIRLSQWATVSFNSCEWSSSQLPVAMYHRCLTGTSSNLSSLSRICFVWSSCRVQHQRLI